MKSNSSSRFFKRELNIENEEEMVKIMREAYVSSSNQSVEAWIKSFYDQPDSLNKRIDEIKLMAEKDQVFGVPTFVVEGDGERYFGGDRFDWLMKRVKREVGEP